MFGRKDKILVLEERAKQAVRDQYGHISILVPEDRGKYIIREITGTGSSKRDYDGALRQFIWNLSAIPPDAITDIMARRKPMGANGNPYISAIGYYLKPKESETPEYTAEISNP